MPKWIAFFGSLIISSTAFAGSYSETREAYRQGALSVNTLNLEALKWNCVNVSAPSAPGLTAMNSPVPVRFKIGVAKQVAGIKSVDLEGLNEFAERMWTSPLDSDIPSQVKGRASTIRQISENRIIIEVTENEGVNITKTGHDIAIDQHAFIDGVLGYIDCRSSILK